MLEKTFEKRLNEIAKELGLPLNEDLATADQSVVDPHDAVEQFINSHPLVKSASLAADQAQEKLVQAQQTAMQHYQDILSKKQMQGQASNQQTTSPGSAPVATGPTPANV